MCGYFLSSLTKPFALWCLVWGFPQPAELTLCVMGFVCTSLGFLGPPSGLWGLCALVSAPQACPLHCRAGVHWFWFRGPSVWVAGLVCTCFVSPACPLCLRACVFFFWLLRPTLCAARVVCTALGLYLFSAPWPALCATRVVCWGGLYATPHLATQACPLCCWISVDFSQFPEPSVWLGPQSPSCSRAEKCRFFCFLPSKSLLCPPQLPLGATCDRASQCMGASPVPGLPPFLRAQAPIQKFSVFSFFHVIILSLTSFQGA